MVNNIKTMKVLAFILIFTLIFARKPTTDFLNQKRERDERENIDTQIPESTNNKKNIENENILQNELNNVASKKNNFIISSPSEFSVLSDKIIENDVLKKAL